MLCVMLMATMGCAHHTLPQPPADASSRWAVPGESAPEFALPSIDGGSFRLSSYSGRVVIVTFWGTFCRPCRDELRELNLLLVRHRDVIVLAVSLDDDDSNESVRKVAAQIHLSFPILRDPSGHVAFTYMKVAMTPFTAIVGRDGRLRAVHRGYSPSLPRLIEEEVQTALTNPAGT